MEHPFPGNVTRDAASLDGYDAVDDNLMVVPIERANIVTSTLDIGDHSLHRPVLDFDFPAKLIPSSTEGHFHLYIDKVMQWEDFKKLLNVMAEVGLLEPGYVSASVARGFTAVRLPWIKKASKNDNPN